MPDKATFHAIGTRLDHFFPGTKNSHAHFNSQNADTFDQIWAIGNPNLNATDYEINKLLKLYGMENVVVDYHSAAYISKI